LSTSRSTLPYESRMEARDGPLIEAMAGLANLYPRYGYRRIQVFMEQLGHWMSSDKAFRLWSTADLQVPKKRARKRVAGSRPRPQLPGGANEVWAYNFVLMPAPTGISCSPRTMSQAGSCRTAMAAWTMLK